MSDLNDQGQIDPSQGANGENNQNPGENNNLSVEEQFNKMKAELESQISEKFKNEIAGLNRKNSELQNIIKTKELEGKTDAEQKELLLKEKENILKEIEELNRGRLVDQELSSVGLPLEFANRITGKDAANIKEDVRALKEFLDNQAKSIADKLINEKMGGQEPQKGKTPDNNILSLEEIAKLPSREARLEAMKKAGY